MEQAVISYALNSPEARNLVADSILPCMTIHCGWRIGAAEPKPSECAAGYFAATIDFALYNGEGVARFSALRPRRGSHEVPEGPSEGCLRLPRKIDSRP